MATPNFIHHLRYRSKKPNLSDLIQNIDSLRNNIIGVSRPAPANFLPPKNARVVSLLPLLMDRALMPPSASEQKETFHIICDMTTPAGIVAMLTAANRGLIDLDPTTGSSSAVDLTMQFWSKNQYLLKRLHDALKKRFPDGLVSLDENVCTRADIIALVDGISAIEAPIREKGIEKITIERRVIASKIHWIVGGVDKGVLYTYSNSKFAFIVDTLYEAIGRGWISHDLFIKHLHWSENDYYGTSNAGGVMQKQLCRLRGKLNIKIEYNKKKGVRFPEYVVRA